MEALCLPASAALPMTTSALYAQVFSLGLIWTSLHCAGMCGPLIAGFGFGRSVGGTAQIGLAFRDVLRYQSGRALLYSAFGALAGLFGSGLADGLQRWSPMLALGAGIIFVSIVLRRTFPGASTAIQAQPPGRLVQWTARIAASLKAYPRMRAFTLGMCLAFLPCMLVAWVMSLAALSASPVHGACIMVLLVGMTVPVLMLAAVVPLVVGRWRHASYSLVPYQELFKLPYVGDYNVQISTFSAAGRYAGACVRVDESAVINMDSDNIALRVVRDEELLERAASKI
jgi:sulfite exporter TauE/SafE